MAQGYCLETEIKATLRLPATNHRAKKVNNYRYLSAGNQTLTMMLHNTGVANGGRAPE